ncbi:hypothetical protein DENSPDRAFT_781704 [Dentipellis sp. KUC8613]|nr:hypothetical protein DENSPDRAFT_781704 [Dentipellis sp. KUC8613]
MFSCFHDSAEYLERKRTDFLPPQITLADLHAVVPRELYKKSTLKGIFFVARDIGVSIVLYSAARHIDTLLQLLSRSLRLNQAALQIVGYALWTAYWWFQGLALAGWWCLGHEAGHGTLSDYRWVNHVVGFSLHTFLLVPYYSWRSTHRAHHKATSSVERDENYVPRTRAQYSLPPPEKSRATDYHELFEETPLYTLGRMLLMQAFGWHAYLAYNAMGSPSYPEGTNHFSPSSALFKPHERSGVIASNIGLSAMASVLFWCSRSMGAGNVCKLYIIPYLLANNWIVLLTFLHHSDPTVPHYRSKEWTFVRGAIATVDRPLLGWAGRFFLHNVSHDHVAHHLFSAIPFYNQPQVTECIKRVLKDDYNYDSTNTFRALYRSFTECCFIEDEGDIVFYKNKDGVTQRRLSTDWKAAAKAEI